LKDGRNKLPSYERLTQATCESKREKRGRKDCGKDATTNAADRIADGSKCEGKDDVEQWRYAMEEGRRKRGAHPTEGKIGKKRQRKGRRSKIPATVEGGNTTSLAQITMKVKMA